MAGTPGYPWPPYPSPSTHEGESHRLQLEAALRTLREQRPQIAAEIGEYLYGLVLQGQMRDPVVLAACRRLYDHEQQALQVEANLRALPAAAPVNQPATPLPPIPVNPPPGAAPGLPSAASDEEMATMVAPPGSRDSGSGAEGGDAATVVQRVGTGSHDAQPPAFRAADLESSETVVSPVRRPEPVASPGAKPAERRCGHCRMPLRANDTTCPVCGRPANEQAASAAQCRRCGTELRPQDRACPVCGTPRT